MRIKLSDSFGVQKARELLEKYILSGCDVELKKIVKLKTIKQLKYLHKMFALFGVENGLFPDEVKSLVKTTLDYTYEKNGYKFHKSLADAPVDEMKEFIERFRMWALEQGCVIPSSEEYLIKQFEIDSYIDKNSFKNSI